MNFKLIHLKICFIFQKIQSPYSASRQVNNPAGQGPKLSVSFSGQISAWTRVCQDCNIYSGIPEFRSFGQKGKFSTFGFRFRPPKVKAEYGRNSRKALDFFFPSVFQDGLVFLIHFWQLIFASTLTLKQYMCYFSSI